jgi:hypothetical protein
VHDERVEVVGEAAGGGGEAGRVQVVDERLEALFGVRSPIASSRACR